MIKKIFLAIIVILILLIGGGYFFLQTKSDFILEQVSNIVEDATGAPLRMESLPSLAFLPMPSVTLDGASWGTEAFFVKFQNANVYFSFSELFKGNFALAEVSLDGLHLVYDAVAVASQEKNSEQSTQATTSENATSIADTTTSSLESTLESAFAFIPENIILTNSTIEYKDSTQTIYLSNLNTSLNNLALNTKTSVSFQSAVAYTLPGESPAQNYELDCKTAFSFLLNGAFIDLDLDTITITPKSGLGFTETMTAEGTTRINVNTFDITQLSAELHSPFLNTSITQTGELNSNGVAVNVKATLFPRFIVQTFAPDTALPNTSDLDEVSMSTSVSYKDEILSLQEFQTALGKASIKTSLVYNQKADSITGEINIADLNVNTFLDASTDATTSHATTDNIDSTTNTTSTASTANTTSASISSIELPTVLQKTNFDIALNVNNVSYDNIVVDTLVTKLQGKNSALTLNPLNINMLDSEVIANVGLNLGSAQSMSLSLSIPTMDINKWMLALADNDYVSGTATVQTNLTFPIGAPLSNLNGAGQIDLSQVTIDSNVLPAVSKILVATQISDTSFEFADGKIPFTFAKSVLNLDKAYLNSSQYYVTASGTVNLINEALNLNAEAGKGENATTTIPVSIQGTMTDPKVAISLVDSAKIVTQILDSTLSTDISSKLNLDEVTTESINEKIDEKLKEGLSNSLNNLFGK